jgi:hypothetical protein
MRRDAISKGDDRAADLELGRPRLILVWLAIVLVTSLRPLADWLSRRLIP